MFTRRLISLGIIASLFLGTAQPALAAAPMIRLSAVPVPIACVGVAAVPVQAIAPQPALAPITGGGLADFQPLIAPQTLSRTETLAVAWDRFFSGSAKRPSREFVLPGQPPSRAVGAAQALLPLGRSAERLASSPPALPSPRVQSKSRPWSFASRIAAIFLLAMTLAGCAFHQPMMDGYAGPRPLPAAIARAFEEPGGLISSRVLETEVNSRFRGEIIELTVGEGLQQRKFSIEYYTALTPGPRPTVIVSPILGGENYPIARTLAKLLAKEGINAALMRRSGEIIQPSDFEKGPDGKLLRPMDLVALQDKVLRQHVINARLTLDWLQARPEVNPKKFGALGISMGGMQTVLLAAIDSRIQRQMIALAGADLPDIIARSHEGSVARYRRATLETLGWSLDDLSDKMRQAMRVEGSGDLSIDPGSLAPSLDARRTLMIISLLDQVVPTKNQLALWELAGRPEVYYLPTGHYTAALYWFHFQVWTKRFFTEGLLEQDQKSR